MIFPVFFGKNTGTKEKRKIKRYKEIFGTIFACYIKRKVFLSINIFTGKLDERKEERKDEA